MAQRTPSTCHLCEAHCGIVVEHDGGRVLGIRGDSDDPFSQGHICPKAAALADLHHDPDRLRKPMVKSRSGEWSEVPWDEALDLVADQLATIRERYGRDAVSVYAGNPTVHSHGAVLYFFLLLRALGTRNFFSSSSTDAWPRLLVSYLMYGSQTMLPIPDIDHTDHMWIIGANPAVSNGSAMTAPGVIKRLKAIRERGGRIIVLDPRRTETARLADEHRFIRPDTDALFLAAVLHVILAENLSSPGRLAYLPGAERIAELGDFVAPFRPDEVAAAVGIPAPDIARLARDFAAAPSAVCYGRLGTCTQEFGALTSWLIDCLHIVTGNLDRRGGAMFPLPAVDLGRLGRLLGQNGSYDRWRSRVSNHPEVNGEFPVLALAEEIETPGPGQIRALVTHAGNPVLSVPNGDRLEKALPGLDFMVAIDIYQNETTRHADVILPPTFGLECDHYPLVFSALAVRNFAKYSSPVFPRPAGARHDWEILLGLTERVIARRGPLGRLGGFAVGAALSSGPSATLRLGLRLGAYPLSLEKLVQNPQGLDLGPLEPRLPGALAGGKLELAPPPLAGDITRLRAALRRRRSANGDSALEMIGRRHLGSNNSWMHNSPKLVKGKDRCTLLMHPDDARSRSIVDGDRVAIASRTGTIEAPVQLTTEMMPGVVSLPHGWGHGRDGTRMSHANAHPGVSINDVTDDTAMDEVSGCARFSVSVEVSRART